MNSDMLAAGVGSWGTLRRSTLSTATTGSYANACDHLAKRFGAPLVTSDPRHRAPPPPGLVDKRPSPTSMGSERWITQSLRARDRLLALHARADRRHLRGRGGAGDGDPQRDRPGDLQPGATPRADSPARPSSRAPGEKLVLLIGRLVYEKGFQLALRGDARGDRAGPRTPVSLSPASGTSRGRAASRQAEELGLMDHGAFLGWIGDDVLHSLYRIADLTVVPSIYEPFGLVALEAAMASGCPLHRRRHWRAARGRPSRGGAGLRFRAHDPGRPRRGGRSGCSPTMTSAATSSPKHMSTCAALIGVTWRPAPARSTAR